MRLEGTHSVMHCPYKGSVHQNTMRLHLLILAFLDDVIASAPQYYQRAQIGMQQSTNLNLQSVPTKEPMVTIQNHFNRRGIQSTIVTTPRAGASQEHNRHPLYFLISIAPPLKPPTKLALGSNINSIGSLKVLCMVLEPRAKLHIKLKYHTLADIPNPKFHPVISYDNNET